jgi:hypothetical protein
LANAPPSPAGRTFQRKGECRLKEGERSQHERPPAAVAPSQYRAEA